mmetsp:Transcript_18446/g.60580  ORF Transcript_18446/g.60580 Transcript_18446/m.60580 type:complete len:80 (-) Transcript_18446:2369-2608(-)
MGFRRRQLHKRLQTGEEENFYDDGFQQAEEGASRREKKGLHVRHSSRSAIDWLIPSVAFFALLLVFLFLCIRTFLRDFW